MERVHAIIKEIEPADGVESVLIQEEAYCPHLPGLQGTLSAYLSAGIPSAPSTGSWIEL